MQLQPLVLACDEQPATLQLLKSELSDQGFRVMTVCSGEDALQVAEAYRPDIALLETRIPGDMTGMDVLRRVRERWAMPVIMLSNHNNALEKVRGLEAGADDFVVKPVSPDELGARIRAVLRRCNSPAAERVVRAEGIEIDILRRRVIRDGQEVVLSRTEWLLLQHLAANIGKVLFNHELLTKVWGPEYRDAVPYLRVWISRLRHKIGDTGEEGRIIRTVPSIGYMLVANEDLAA